MDYSLADFESELLNWGDDDGDSSIENDLQDDNRDGNDTNSIMNLQPTSGNSSPNKIVSDNSNNCNTTNILRPKRNSSSTSNTISLSTTTPISSQVMSSSKSSKNNSITSESRTNTASNSTTISNNYNNNNRNNIPNTNNNMSNTSSTDANPTRASVNFTSHPSMILQMAAVSQFPLNWNNNCMNNNSLNTNNMQLLNQFQLNPELIFSSVAVAGAPTDNFMGQGFGTTNATIKSNTPIQSNTQLSFGSSTTNPISTTINTSNRQQNNNQPFLSNYSQALPTQQNVVCLDGTTNNTVMSVPFDATKSPTSSTQPINFDMYNKSSNVILPPTWNLPQSQQYFNKPNNNESFMYQEEKNPVMNTQQHYGLTVNGFHPQVNAQDNPHLTPMDTYNMINNRNNSNKRNAGKSLSCKERNEREQKRAQKISDLIESLRLSMVNSGWKVEVKSKYHTLAKCTEYVRHLIQVTTEKEKALERAKAMSTENNLVKTENESVTSSLTSCSLDNKKKRKLNNSMLSESTNNNALSKSLWALNKAAQYTTNDKTNGPDESSKEKKNTSSVAGDNSSPNNSTTSTRNNQHPHAVSSITYNKMLSSSISEMTDSNTSSTKKSIIETEKQSSSGDHGSPNKEEKNEMKKHKKKIIFVDNAELKLENDNADPPKPERRSSTSTTAAVASIKSDPNNTNNDHSSKKKRKRKSSGSTKSDKLWVSEKGDVDYEEVFQTSNVPQIIATIAGRIVTWNRVFLKATGLTSKQTSRLTLFSLVQGDKLSNLFEVVGNLLRMTNQQKLRQNSNDEDEKQSKKKRIASSSSSSPTREVFKKREDITTLPCILFPSNCCRENSHPNLFYMTITLINDDTESLKEAISTTSANFLHCVLTDSPPGCNGIGGVTSKLLARMYACDGTDALACERSN